MAIDHKHKFSRGFNFLNWFFDTFGTRVMLDGNPHALDEGAPGWELKLFGRYYYRYRD